MTFSRSQQRLLAALEQMEIIDAHEHLPPETVRLEQEVDVFTLFSHYTHRDLQRAGMSEEAYQGLFDRTVPIEKRWTVFEPYWERIRFTSYSRSVLLSTEKFFGFPDITRDTYRDISQAIRDHNQPGLYDRVLRQTCHIRACLTQFRGTDTGTDLLIPVMPLMHPMERWEEVHHPPFAPETACSSLDAYMEAVRAYVRRVKAEGAVGLKMHSFPFGAPDRPRADALFKRLKSGAVKEIPVIWPTGEPADNALKDYVVDETITYAGELDLVVAVHAGYWGDFRRLHPLHMIPILERHPDVRFDIYHLGYPWIRETLMLGKGFSNVWLNLCWNHIISERSAAMGLDEAIDLLPANKLIGFGGDYRTPVEKVYGHLVMARRNIARVLGRRIDEGTMTEEQALGLARQWLWENPKELYRLELS